MVTRPYLIWPILVAALMFGSRLCRADEPVTALMPGTRFATKVYSHSGSRPGPTVLVTGGVHGDEPAGAAAAEQIARWKVAAGRLVVIPHLNEPGLNVHRRTIPDIDEPLADLNRDFARAEIKEEPRGAPARAIWDFVVAQHPAWLVDLHEAHTVHGTAPESVGNLILACRSPEFNKAETALLSAVNGPKTEPRWKFAVGRAPRDGSLARAAGEHVKIASFIVETTRTDQPLSVRVEDHCRIVRGLLVYLKMQPLP